jgi:hypothetical protein
MQKNKLDRLIEIIREQMVTGSSAGGAGFSGSADPKGPTAGFDPVMELKRRKGPQIKLPPGSRKRWQIDK